MGFGATFDEAAGSETELEDADVELLHFVVEREDSLVNAPDLQETVARLEAKLPRSKVELPRF